MENNKMTNQEAVNVMEKYTDITLSKTVIEAHNMAIAALKKQIPKKPIKKDDKCPFKSCLTCGGFLDDDQNHCEHCGQAIDWSE